MRRTSCLPLSPFDVQNFSFTNYFDKMYQASPQVLRLMWWFEVRMSLLANICAKTIVHIEDPHALCVEDRCAYFQELAAWKEEHCDHGAFPFSPRVHFDDEPDVLLFIPSEHFTPSASPAPAPSSIPTTAPAASTAPAHSSSTSSSSTRPQDVLADDDDDEMESYNSFVHELFGSGCLTTSYSVLPGPEGKKKKWIKRLIKQIYAEHNPSKLKDVDRIMLKYHGRELELLEDICVKYAGGMMEG